MTSLQLHALIAVMFGYQFVSALVNRRRTALRSERAVQAVVAVPLGICVAGSAFILVSDFAHPDSVTRVDAWQVWLFVVVDALLLAMLAVQIIRGIMRAIARA